MHGQREKRPHPGFVDYTVTNLALPHHTSSIQSVNCLHPHEEEASGRENESHRTLRANSNAYSL